MDLVESLVRKSLVTVERASEQTRYGMLETIRQFAKDRSRRRPRSSSPTIDMHDTTRAQPPSTGRPGTARTASRARWVPAEFANLRTAFRWAADHRELSLSTTIAAHATIMGWPLQRFEPVAWSRRSSGGDRGRSGPTPKAVRGRSLCLYGGRPDVGVGYAEEAGGWNPIRVMIRSSTVGAACCRPSRTCSVDGSIAG